MKKIIPFLLALTLSYPAYAGLTTTGAGKNPSGGGVSAPRSPSILLGANCVGWFDAKVTGSVVVSTGVSAWTTQCGTMTAIQASGSQQPTYDSGIDVNFSSSLYNLSLASAPTGAYAIVIAGTDLGGGAFRPVAYSGPSNQFGAYCNTSFYGMFNGGSHQFGSLTCPGTKGIYYASVDGSKVPSGALNGGVVTANSGGTALTTSTLANLGGDGGGNNFGKVNEVVIANTNAISAVYDELVAYLACANGISSHTLPMTNAWYGYCV